MKSKTGSRFPSFLVLTSSFVILFALLFFAQRLAIKREFTKNSSNRSEFIRELCLEALAGNDFLFLQNTLVALRDKDTAITEIYLTFPGNSRESAVMPLAGKSIFRSAPENEEHAGMEEHPGIAGMREHAGIAGTRDNAKSQKHTENQDDSKGRDNGGKAQLSNLLFAGPEFHTRSPLILAEKKVATLTVVYDTSGVNGHLRNLLIQFVGAAVLLLLLYSFLLGKEMQNFARRHPGQGKQWGSAQPRPDSLTGDPFALPQIGPGSALELNPDIDPAEQELTSEEKKIIQSLDNGKKLGELIQECGLDELLIFELVKGLMNRRIIKAYPQEDTTINLQSLLK